VAFLYVLLWNLGSLKQYATTCCPSKGVGSSIGLAGYLFFSASLLFSSRWRKLEDWIGGLDQLYHLHRKFGIIGFSLMLIHPWVEAVKWLPQRALKFVFITLPVHGRFSVNLGSFAFWLTVIILGITLLKVLRYDRWKRLHTFMILVFILASLHVLLSRKRFGSEFSHFLFLIPMCVGFFGILYREVFFRFFAKKYLFKVEHATHVSPNVTELILSPIGDRMSFIPGQYGFFSFSSPSLTKEAHPFTCIGSVDDSTIALLVKARGDFTKNLYHHINREMVVQCEGPYGRFSYVHGGPSQIWIGGGIGIVAFIAWVRSMKRSDWENIRVDLYYCVHNRTDAIYCDEFQRVSGEYANFRWFLHCSEDGNRLDVPKVLATSGGFEGKKIYMCGPEKLTRNFSKKFVDFGVKDEDIAFEDFDFF
jgi:predicted ferric reductase